MTGATVLAGAGAAVAGRRGLASTAEAVSLLTVGLALLDAFGARSAGLAGLDQVNGLSYWAGASVVVAALCAAASPYPLVVAHLSRSASRSPCRCSHLADISSHPAAVSGPVRFRRGPGPRPRQGAQGRRSRDVRIVYAAGGARVVRGELRGLTRRTADRFSGAWDGPARPRRGAAGCRGARLPALARRRTASAGLVVAAAWAVPTTGGLLTPARASAVAVVLLALAVAVPRQHRRAPRCRPRCVGAPGWRPSRGGHRDRRHLAWLDRPWEGGTGGAAMLTSSTSHDLSWGWRFRCCWPVSPSLCVADRCTTSGTLPSRLCRAGRNDAARRDGPTLRSRS